MITTAENPPAVQISEEEKILFTLEKARQAVLLTEMNGEKCANRQLWKLAVYDRPQRIAM